MHRHFSDDAGCEEKGADHHARAQGKVAKGGALCRQCQRDDDETREGQQAPAQAEVVERYADIEARIGLQAPDERLAQVLLAVVLSLGGLVRVASVAAEPGGIDRDGGPFASLIPPPKPPSGSPSGLAVRAVFWVLRTRFDFASTILQSLLVQRRHQLRLVVVGRRSVTCAASRSPV
ncbi:MAG: hypothetical protein HY815_13745 [Candidatus Riflebacteria bacterium]|nr:hypothetical protein [Candidatus Riflebacteria bacterium]